MEKKRSNFTGSIGFVLAAAGSAVGLGDISEIPVSGSKRWRRSVYSVLCGTGTYLWVYVADNRDRGLMRCTESAYCI